MSFSRDEPPNEISTNALIRQYTCCSYKRNNNPLICESDELEQKIRILPRVVNFYQLKNSIAYLLTSNSIFPTESSEYNYFDCFRDRVLSDRVVFSESYDSITITIFTKTDFIQSKKVLDIINDYLQHHNLLF